MEAAGIEPAQAFDRRHPRRFHIQGTAGAESYIVSHTVHITVTRTATSAPSSIACRSAADVSLRRQREHGDRPAPQGESSQVDRQVNRIEPARPVDSSRTPVYAWSVARADSVSTAAAPRRRTRVRALGAVLIVVGVLTLIWTLIVWRDGDPVTSLYTRWEQHKLAGQYEALVAHYRVRAIPPRSSAAEAHYPVRTIPPQARAAEAHYPVRTIAPHAPAAEAHYPVRTIAPHASASEAAREILVEARRFRRKEPQGAAIGRLVVPRLGLNMVLVNGTDAATLRKGPGRDLRTYMPGEGELVYVAGHRTTYLAPFARIDELRPGDRVTLRVPYATFDYKVTGHRIVDSHNLSVLRSHHHEVVALQACHPRFFATHRYIVWAKPVRVTPRHGRPYVPRVAARA